MQIDAVYHNKIIYRLIRNDKVLYSIKADDRVVHKFNMKNEEKARRYFDNFIKALL